MQPRPQSFLSRLRLKTSSSRTVQPTKPDNDALDGFNDQLEQLLEVYPFHGASVCRRRLLDADMACPMEDAAVSLAETPAANQDTPITKLEDWEHIRSDEYKSAVKSLLRKEFPKIKDSSIKAVLAENNYDYRRSQAVLNTITTQSWRRTIASILLSRGSSGAITPLSVPLASGSPELDAELHTLHHGPKRLALLESDLLLAQTINEEEYREADSLFECRCCFGECAWEDIASCPEMHYFCRTCLKRSVEESLYGQASSGLDYERNSVRCIATLTDHPCSASIPLDMLPHYLPQDTFSALMNQFSKTTVDQAFRAIGNSNSDRLENCPFCPYAVVRPGNPPTLGHSEDDSPWLVQLLFFILLELFLGLLIRIYITLQAAWRYITSRVTPARDYPPLPNLIFSPFVDHRTRPPKIEPWDTIFRCQNLSQCGRSSCRECKREWIGFHDCTNGVDSKRAFVERRMDEALKRTCPQCNTSFLKSDGCNKMTCPCGYKLCYLCRADVRETKYDHFCPHFRGDNPGEPCRECELCELYGDENEEELVKEAKARAEQEWESGRRG